MRLRKKRTKNLTYNENTKVIEVKKNTENKVQLFLEHNKIYFETIMMLILSFAGIIVSIVGVKVAMVVAKRKYIFALTVFPVSHNPSPIFIVNC